jgi:hypothetical protein
MSDDDHIETRHVARIPGISTRERLRIVVAAGLFLGVVVLLASLDDAPAIVPEATHVAVVPTAGRTAAPAGSSVTPRPVPTPAPPGAFACRPVSDLASDPWLVHPCDHRGENGRRYAYDCPAGGTPGTIWGDIAYTDDSSVCGAAVHAGALTRERGGTVTIVMRLGRAGYVGTERNGITSLPWDGWGGSFEIIGSTVRLTPGCVPAFDFPPGDAWLMTACPYRGDHGRVLSYVCPPGGAPGTVWGDGFYTDDSSVCTAAVHAGVLTGSPGSPIRADASNGGWTISLVVRPGEDAYAGVTRNGVTSKPWDVWEGSFEFVTR